MTVWSTTKAKLSVLVKKQLGAEDSAFMMVDSKSRGNWDVIDQLMGMRGIVVNPSGTQIEFQSDLHLKKV